MNKCRKIAFILKWPLSYNGGGENWLKSVIKELCLRGHLIDVYLPDFYINQVKNEKDCECINYIYFHSSSGNIMRKLGLENFSWPLIHFKMDIKYDVIYTPSLYAFRFFKESKYEKIIFGTHDYYHPNRKFSRDIVIFIFLLLLKRYKKDNIFVHCIDKIIKSKLSFLGNKAILIENFPFSSSKLPDDSELFTVLYMNVLNKRKGVKYLPDLVDYFKNIPNARLLITGKADKKYAKLIKHKENQNAEYLGYVSEEVKRSIMQTSNLFLLLSDREGFPLSLLDSLNAGIPVLSTWNPISHILDKKFFTINAVTITERKTEYIKNTYQKYFKLWEENKSEYLIMRNKIQEYTELKFNKDKQLDKIIKMFEEI